MYVGTADIRTSTVPRMKAWIKSAAFWRYAGSGVSGVVFSSTCRSIFASRTAENAVMSSWGQYAMRQHT